METLQVTPWPDDDPSPDRITREFGLQGLRPFRWSNGAGDSYDVHTHDYHKVLYCVTGSITFKVEGESVELHPGDRLDLPAGRSHSAVVGPEGVVCMEAQA